MKSNISIAFEKCRKEKRPALITYTVGGDNTKKKSLAASQSLVFKLCDGLILLIPRSFVVRPRGV